MPQVIPAIIGAVVSSAVGGGIVGGILGAVATGLASTVVARFTDSKSEAFDAAARGTLVNVANNVEPLGILYGTRRIGGPRFFGPETPAAGTPWIWLGVAFSEGPVSAINAVYLDDTPITDPRFSPNGQSLVSIEKWLGAEDQAASVYAMTAHPGKWTANHRGRGVAYLFAELRYQKEVWQGVPTITADVDGRIVYDPRDGQYRFSTNPWLCIRDYLTNTRYGRGIPESVIDDVSFTTEANHCDELVSVPDGAGGTTTQKRYELCGVVNPDRDWLDNVRDMLTSCRGTIVFEGGKLRAVSDRARVQANYAFTEDNILGRWSFQPPGKRQRVNRVRARCFNPARDWQPDIAIWDSPTARALDNERLLERELALTYTTNLYRAQQMALIEGKRSRQSIAARFTVNLEGLQAQVGDVVPITHSTPGWNAKLFEITNLRIKPDTDEIDVEVLEYQADHYTLDPLEQATPTPATNLPNPFTVVAPGSLAVTSGDAFALLSGDGTLLQRLRVTWATIADGFVAGGGRIEIQYKPQAESAWQEAPAVAGNATEALVGPVRTGVAYDVRIRAVNTLGRTSAWTSTAHSVTGKTTGPAAPIGLAATTLPKGVRLTWAVSADLDRAYTEIWRSATNDRNAATRIAITDGSSYDHTGLLPLAQGYYWVRDVNFSRVAGGWNPAGATSGIVGTAGFVQADDLDVGQLSAISANLGTVTAGTVDLASDPNGTGWGYLRSAGKDWQDGETGWLLGRLPALSGNPAVALLEFRGAANMRFELGSWGYGVLQFPNFYVDSNGYMQVDAVDVIKTLNIQGQAVTVPVGAYVASVTTSPAVQATIACSGAPIFCDFAARTAGGGAGYVQVYRNGVLLFSFGDTFNQFSGTFAFSFMDAPGVGTWTYQLYTFATSWQHASVRLLEVKR